MEDKSVEKKLKKSGRSRKLKTPKGTRDRTPLQTATKEELLSNIVQIFKCHGAVCIETPLFELKEILTGKYGEESKLIYDLADQGGELCSLRYDLTVPFARYVASHHINQIKCYQIGRVYRRDNPVMTKGRFREFYQCDFDIAGNYDLMVADSEAISIIAGVLELIDIGYYLIRVNNRKLLDSILSICGVPENSMRKAFSAIDKLDKSTWDEVKTELLKIDGLTEESVKEIESFFYIKASVTPKDVVSLIRSRPSCKNNESILEALKEMEILFDYLECFKIIDHIVFDLSLVRGVDYYTGVIYEAVIATEEGRKFGSVAAGGRYDNLIGMFGSETPAVGLSIGVERILSIMESKQKTATRGSETEVLVISLQENMIKEQMKVCAELWEYDIKTEFVPRVKASVFSQLGYANHHKIPFAIFVPPTEEGTLTLKNLATGIQSTHSKDQIIEIINCCYKNIIY